MPNNNYASPRYDPDWDESEQSMQRHPQGDYVKYNDYEEKVDELQERIDTLQKIVNAVHAEVRGEAT